MDFISTETGYEVEIILDSVRNRDRKYLAADFAADVQRFSVVDYEDCFQIDEFRSNHSFRIMQRGRGGKRGRESIEKGSCKWKTAHSG